MCGDHDGLVIVPLEMLQRIEAELKRAQRTLVHLGPNIDTERMALDALSIKDVSISNSLALLETMKPEESEIKNEIPIFGAASVPEQMAVQLKFMGNILRCARYSTVKENLASVVRAFEVLTGFPASDLMFTKDAELLLYSQINKNLPEGTARATND
jgi:hypothetical protein